jgi:hypothetical protein
LLIATMFSEACMPTLCWIAPEMPAGEVELGRDGLARLADLARVRVPARVDHGARGGHRGRAAERLGQVLHEVEALGLAQAAAAGHEDVGALDVHVGAALLAAGDHPGLRRVLGELDVDGRHLGGPASPLRASKAFRRPMMMPRSL